MIACSDSNNDIEEGGDSGTPENNLSEAAKLFVGYWINEEHDTTDDENYLFKGDGMCRTVNARSSIVPLVKGYPYYWSLNESTGVLATTTEKSWEINLSNEVAWSGVSLTLNPKTESYKKASNLDYIFVSLANTSWKNDGGDKTLYLSATNGLSHAFINGTNSSMSDSNLLSDIDLGNYKWACVVLSEDNDENDYTLNYDIGLLDNDFDIVRNTAGYIVSKGKGSITLKNPHSTTKCQLVLTGKYNLTMNLDIEAEKE